tara:strand:+ start:883 stop:1116 length:234 start_codon:yes stop_codon:yes gene_type:complete
MGNNKYSNIGKKQIIGVINQLIQKMEALEMTLNILVMFVDKEKEFNDFMQKQLGGNNGLQSDAGDNTGRDTTEGTED